MKSSTNVAVVVSHERSERYPLPQLHVLSRVIVSHCEYAYSGSLTGRGVGVRGYKTVVVFRSNYITVL